MSDREIIVTPSTQALYDNFHFAPANRVGDMVWVSGQVGIDEHLRPGDGISAQSAFAFQNLEAVLGAAGATLADVVELTTFHLDLEGEMAAFSQVKDEYFPDRFPAWTAVGTTALAMPELRVEVRAVAVVGSGGK